ncbi:peptidylprolyl isomerase [Candidatus Woesearchaeota archaeon]|nr:peptidylprolyl isomerase [Candidatus Woesearchaeota archaeon]
MAIKKHDFVEIEYTGKVTDSGDIFDTTDEKIAKEAQIYQEGERYKPIIVCIGEGNILKGLDDFIEGKEPGKYTVDIDAEHAFGKKNPKLIQMIPARRFTEQKVQPVPGLRLNIDNRIGIIRSVNGGRIIVDFNHPLSGRDVTYDIKINRIVTDKKECIASIFNTLLGLPDLNITVEGEKATVELPELPEQILNELKKKVKELVKIDLEFKTPKKE